jgi:hypothetical protein
MSINDVDCSTWHRKELHQTAWSTRTWKSVTRWAVWFGFEGPCKDRHRYRWFCLMSRKLNSGNGTYYIGGCVCSRYFWPTAVFTVDYQSYCPIYVCPLDLFSYKVCSYSALCGPVPIGMVWSFYGDYAVKSSQISRVKMELLSNILENLFVSVIRGWCDERCSYVCSQRPVSHPVSQWLLVCCSVYGKHL